MNVYAALNIFFFVFHTCIVLFNALGWIWKRTRPYNLILLLLTSFSWFVLGIWKGWGYCILTDWHYRVLEKLGYHDIPNSYIKFLIVTITGINVNERLVDAMTLIVFLAAFILSVTLNTRDWRQKHKKRVKIT